MEAVIAAAAGIAGTVVGTLLGPFVQARLDQGQWLRNERAALYAEACYYAEMVKGRLRDRSQFAIPADHDEVGGRLALVGDDAARRGWVLMLQALRSFRTGAPVADDDQAWDQALAACDAFQRVCRRCLLGS
jgi:hypothetical protein